VSHGEPQVYLAECSVFDPAISGVRVLYFSTGAGFTTRPTETPPNVTFRPLVLQPAFVRRDLFSEGTTLGRSRIGYGDLVLNNEDGALDALIDYGFDGRPVVIRVGPPEGSYPGAFSTVLTGSMEQPEITSGRVTIRIHDRQFDADRPLQTTKYLGDNALPNGLEGVADDLKGKPKPVCYGVVRNVPAIPVNTNRRIYQVNDGPVVSVDAVYDRGSQLVKDTDYISRVDMETTAPGAGLFRAWPAGGYFRLGSAPAGLVTADATEGASVAERTTAQVWKRLLNGRALIPTSDISAADLSALDTRNPAPIGVWAPDEERQNAVLDRVTQSAGAWWGVDRSGVFRVKRLEDPSAEASQVTFGPDEIKDLERVPANDADRGLPVFRVKLRYSPNYAVQTTDLAGVVTEARRAELAQPHKEVTATDPAVQTKHLLAPELIVDTLLAVGADAQVECDRVLTLRKTRRDQFRFWVPLEPEYAAVDLGIVVTVRHDRFGLSAGKQFRVVGIEPDAAQDRLTLQVWG
jgi:hypothetical protein